MHMYPMFEIRDEAERIAFVRERRFANLVVNGPDGPLAAHLPMLLIEREDGQLILEGHVAKSNPLAGAAARAPGLAIFNGADAYVAAGFYPSKQVHGKVAPTWNYVAVHAAGPIETFSEASELTGHLVRLTDFLEAEEPEPWAVDDAPEGFTERLVTSIVGLRMEIESFDGMAKLNQNSRDHDRAGVVEGLARRGVPHEQRIVERMRLLES